MFVDCSQILPDRLWVGSFVRPEQVRTLRRLGITTVICLQSNQDISEGGVSLKKLAKAYGEAEIELTRVPVQDFNKKDLQERLPAAVARLEEALKPRWTRVYLHCTAGIHRGPTVAAAYLMKVHAMTVEQAFQFVTDRRQCSPYLDVLEVFGAEQSCVAENSPEARSGPAAEKGEQ